MVKYIHFFGTSLTAGGGFEFETLNSDRKNNLFHVYGNTSLQKTQFDYSYPGQFEKLVKDNGIKINNFAKNGYGNERTYRHAFEIINSSNFNSDEHFFVFEFSFMGRKELFFNPIDDYISFNYKYGIENYEKEKKQLFKNISIANSYWYDSNIVMKKISDATPFFTNYTKYILNVKNEFENFFMENNFFYSYLLQKGVKFLVLKNECNILIDEKYKINFQNLINDVKLAEHTDVYDFIMKMKLTITHETHGVIDDLHFGMFGNMLLSEILFNKMIDLKIISFEKKDIDWDFYKNINCQKHNNLNFDKKII